MIEDISDKKRSASFDGSQAFFTASSQQVLLFKAGRVLNSGIIMLRYRVREFLIVFPV